MARPSHGRSSTCVRMESSSTPSFHAMRGVAADGHADEHEHAVVLEALGLDGEARHPLPRRETRRPGPSDARAGGCGRPPRPGRRAGHRRGRTPSRASPSPLDPAKRKFPGPASPWHSEVALARPRGPRAATTSSAKGVGGAVHPAARSSQIDAQSARSIRAWSGPSAGRGHPGRSSADGSSRCSRPEAARGSRGRWRPGARRRRPRRAPRRRRRGPSAGRRPSGSTARRRGTGRPWSRERAVHDGLAPEVEGGPGDRAGAGVDPHDEGTAFGLDAPDLPRRRPSRCARRRRGGRPRIPPRSAGRPS